MTIALFWLIGLILVFLEFFLPGMIFGTAGAIMLLASVFFFAREYTSEFLILAYCFLVALSLMVIIKAALAAIRRTRKSQSFLSDDAQDGYVASTYDKSAIGKVAVVLSDLKPGGYILVDDKKVQALSASGYIVAGSKVEVIGGQEDALIVKIHTASEI